MPPTNAYPKSTRFSDDPEFVVSGITANEWARISEYISSEFVANAFCPTGVGGGVDPSCKSDDSESWTGVNGTKVVSKGTQTHDDGTNVHVELSTSRIMDIPGHGPVMLAGPVTLADATRERGQMTLAKVHADEELRGKGLPNRVIGGIAAIALKEGLPLRTTGVFSSAGKGMMEKFVRVGMATRLGNGDYELNRERFAAIAINAFCPTGPGGGVDPSCSPGKGGAKAASGPVSGGSSLITAAGHDLGTVHGLMDHLKSTGKFSELTLKKVAFLNPNGIQGGKVILPTIPNKAPNQAQISAFAALLPAGTVLKGKYVTEKNLPAGFTLPTGTTPAAAPAASAPASAPVPAPAPAAPAPTTPAPSAHEIAEAVKHLGELSMVAKMDIDPAKFGVKMGTDAGKAKDLLESLVSSGVVQKDASGKYSTAVFTTPTSAPAPTPSAVPPAAVPGPPSAPTAAELASAKTHVGQLSSFAKSNIDPTKFAVKMGVTPYKAKQLLDSLVAKGELHNHPSGSGYTTTSPPPPPPTPSPSGPTTTTSAPGKVVPMVAVAPNAPPGTAGLYPHNSSSNYAKPPSSPEAAAVKSQSGHPGPYTHILPNGSASPAFTAENPHAIASPNRDCPDQCRPPMNTPVAKAFTAYSGSSYGAINEPLRDGKAPTGNSLTYFNNMQKAFAAAPPFDPPPIALTRGITVNQSTLVNLRDAAVEAMNSGKTASMAGFVSASTPSGSSFGGNVYFHINAVHGVDMRAHSLLPGEGELLLNHNAQYRPTKVEVTSSGELHLWMDQVRPQHHESTDISLEGKWKKTV